jgi:hypothetical protein
MAMACQASYGRDANNKEEKRAAYGPEPYLLCLSLHCSGSQVSHLENKGTRVWIQVDLSSDPISPFYFVICTKLCSLLSFLQCKMEIFTLCLVILVQGIGCHKRSLAHKFQ